MTTRIVAGWNKLDGDGTLYVTGLDSDGVQRTVGVNAGGELKTTDQASTQEAMLKELKIMNMHLALLTDTHIRKQEVE